MTDIGAYAFSSCDSLTILTIPSSVDSIMGGSTSEDEGAFSFCTGLTSVTINCNAIGIRAFAECENLESVVISDNVTTIYGDAFYNCSSVTDVYCYPNPANLTWYEDAKDDFKEDGSTICHVYS